MAVEKSPAAPGSFASQAFENPHDIIVPESHRAAERSVLAGDCLPNVLQPVVEIAGQKTATPVVRASAKKELAPQAPTLKRGDRLQTKQLGIPVVVLNPCYAVLEGTGEVIVSVATTSGERWLCRERDLKPRRKKR